MATISLTIGYSDSLAKTRQLGEPVNPLIVTDRMADNRHSDTRRILLGVIKKRDDGVGSGLLLDQGEAAFALDVDTDPLRVLLDFRKIRHSPSCVTWTRRAEEFTRRHRGCVGHAAA